MFGRTHLSVLTGFFCASLVVLATSAEAGVVTAWTYQDDGDGAVVCTNAVWTDMGLVNGVNTYGVSIAGDQFWQPAHIQGSVTTETEEDPTLLISNAIDNDSGVAWIGYQSKITMNKAFTISNATVSGDWTVAAYA